MIKTIRIDQITRDPQLQMRAQLHAKTIQEYASLLNDGYTFPPITVFEVEDREHYLLTDGFHRLAAYDQCGVEEVKALIDTGSTRDALYDALTSNTEHGLPRSNKDKRKAVTTLLCDDEWRGWSNSEIGRKLAVSHVFVGKVRGELEDDGIIPTTTTRTYQDQDGNLRQMNTAACGAYQQEEDDAVPPYPFDLSEEEKALRPQDSRQDKEKSPACGTEDSPAEDLPLLPSNTSTLTQLPQHLSESNEWYSPEDIVARARACMGGIDLDPASCEEANHVVQATRFFTKEDNGLGQPWEGRIWLNPPYGKTGGRSNAGLWTEEAIYRFNDDEIQEAIVLVNASTGAKWFQALWAFPVCFVEGRLCFNAPSGSGEKDSPTHYNALIFLAPEDRWEAFGEAFLEVGHIAWPQSATKRGEVG